LFLVLGIYSIIIYDRILLTISDLKYDCLLHENLTTYLLCSRLSKVVIMFYFNILTRTEFPTLSSQRSSVMKDQSPVNRQKSQAGRLPVSSAAPANQSGKGKAEASNKQTGAVAYFFTHVCEVSLRLSSKAWYLQRQWTSVIGARANGSGSLEQMVLNCL
jgi:hypothetical protein